MPAAAKSNSRKASEVENKSPSSKKAKVESESESGSESGSDAGSDEEEEEGSESEKVLLCRMCGDLVSYCLIAGGRGKA